MEVLPESALDRTNYRRYRDGLRHADEHAQVLQPILESLAEGERRRARLQVDDALNLGGPLYAVGHDMALTIETTLGIDALVDTVERGPIAFFETYGEAVLKADEPTILPPDLGPEIVALKNGYGRSWLSATMLRREGLRMLLRGRPGDAIETLGLAVRLDGTDAISAYNLACAYSLEKAAAERLPGKRTRLEQYAQTARREKALRWLDEALRRGFDDHKQVRVDPDLESLHGDPGYHAVLRKHGIELSRREMESAPGRRVNP